MNALFMTKLMPLKYVLSRRFRHKCHYVIYLCYELFGEPIRAKRKRPSLVPTTIHILGNMAIFSIALGTMGG
jgi:hypothetical protein